jgi:HlyD family secretion protein
MLKIIKNFFSMLTAGQRKSFYILQILVISMTIAEIASIALIVPLMALVSDLSILERENLLAAIYLKSNIVGPYNFMFYLSIVVLINLTIAAIFSMFVTWRMSMFATKVGVEIGDKLYSYYLSQDWLFHTMGSSSNMTKKIANETTRITNEILLPTMILNARIVLALFIILFMFIYDPIILTISLIIFGSTYIILYKFVQKRLTVNSKQISDMFLKRFKLMSEGFGGIKEILLLGRTENLKQNFFKTGDKLAYSQGNNRTIAQLPKYLLELLVFSSMIFLILYLIAVNDENLVTILPILSVYALVAIKLLPALQQIYFSIAVIKGNLSAYESIQDDLNKANLRASQDTLSHSDSDWSKSNKIDLKNITFTYPGNAIPSINNISLTIKPNTLIGFVGTSGSGKSTLIDIIIGLINPQKGQIKIDETILNNQNIRTWQNKIGFVPQEIFLTEGSIAENITFGINRDLIDYNQVNKAIKLAHLDEWVSELDHGINTKIGERGVKISGGQKQRLGIARALYYDADLIVFDEGTSSLDGISEKKIMNAVHDLASQKTLIMIAHKLQTVKKCDQIYMMEKGQIVDNGTYQQLIEGNKKFKEMSFNS